MTEFEDSESLVLLCTSDRNEDAEELEC